MAAGTVHIDSALTNAFCFLVFETGEQLDTPFRCVHGTDTIAFDVILKV